MLNNKFPNWVKYEMYRNHLFMYDYVGMVFHQSNTLEGLPRTYRSSLLEWVFENIAEGFDELITNPPQYNYNNWQQWLKVCKSLYKDKIFPLYKRRKHSLTFHYGEGMAFIDIHDLEITSKFTGPNDNFEDDSSPQLDAIYNF